MAELDPTKVYFTKYTNERLGAAFIGENSGKTVTEALAASSEVIDTVSGDVETISGDVATVSGNVSTISGDVETVSGNVGTLSGTVTSHTDNATIHVTAADKTLWNSKLSPSDIQSLFGWADYNENTKRINFYSGSSSETVLCYVDATDFIKDGMIENVQIKNVQISGQSVSCLVISFNTDSGKEDINIPLSDLFDPTNYYNKTEIDTKLGSGITVSSVTEVVESDERVFSEAINDLNTKKADTSAVTEAISSAVSSKVNRSELAGYTTTGTTSVLSGTVTSHTSNSTIHLTSTEKTNVGALATNIAAISGVTSTKVSNWDGAASKAHTHSNKTAIDSLTGSVGTMAYQNTGSYSSATQVNSALAGKSNTGHGHSISDVANLQSSLDGKSGTGHTHGISIATDSGTNQLTMAASTKYKITAGGQSYIFTTPPDNNTWRPLGTGASDACAGNDSRLSDARTPTAHNQASNTITTMAGYSKPSATSAIATGDTLNAAVGKLEKALDGKQPSGNYLTSHQSVTLASGTNNGTLKITTAAGTTDNVAVKGINTMAYQATGSYSSATQVNSALAGKSDTGHTHNYAGSSSAGGVANSAAKLSNTSAIGSATKPVFFTNGGVPSACTYTLEKSVPSNAVFTDTDTWRPITNTYTGSDQSTSVSQYGTNALYNALVNGYASSAGNADTVDSKHATDFASGNNGNANYLRTYWANSEGNDANAYKDTQSSHLHIGYNTTNWFNNSTSWRWLIHVKASTGQTDVQLQLGSGIANGERYLFQRQLSGSANWSNWYKLSAGYADSAGSVAWTNVSDRPTNLNQFTNGPGYITGINKTMVVNALGYTPPTADTNTVTSINGKTGAIAAADMATVLTSAGYKLTDTTYNFNGTSFTSNNSNGVNANDVAYNSHTYYTSNGPATSLGASTTDGALYTQAYSTTWVGQIAQDYRNGGLYVRGKNNGTWQSWYKVWDSRNLTNLNQLSNGPGYITGINKTMVVNALGYTPPTTDTNTWRPLGTGATDACAGNDSRLSNSRPASDVYSWAKASSKPSYSIGEISGIQVLNGTMTTVQYNDGDGNGRWASYLAMSVEDARKVISFQYIVTNKGGGFDGNQGCTFFSKNGWGYGETYTNGTLSITNSWFHLWGAGSPGTVYYNIIKRT